ncbi:RNA 2',3'-cyclic phosphodiesterase [Thermocrinis minervae]|uniref:RNA 2',3'-cyclic phosphodiesterase n=1 Tax=Thermocrinis minervae TaxID=381751 RepID=A0A1M6RWE8_9AQUI|nr:RNA 2',3'-cyclic phosphodiesterase [Thermocrinis minervae]SHK36619.1 2'-5' RNA ligase [Thermocrinis minervae]
MVRLFVGTFVTNKLQEHIEKLQEEAEDIIKGKWVEPQNLHITLQFIGEVDEKKVMSIIKAVQDVSRRFPPIEVRYRSLGVFPDLDRARVLWIGVDQGHDKLKALAKAVERANLSAGIRRDGKPFYPHVTVCRIKEFNRKGLKDLLRRYERTSFCEDTINSIAVIKSSLTSVGPIYSVLEEFVLNG